MEKQLLFSSIFILLLLVSTTIGMPLLPGFQDCTHANLLFFLTVVRQIFLQSLKILKCIAGFGVGSVGPAPIFHSLPPA